MRRHRYPVRAQVLLFLALLAAGCRRERIDQAGSRAEPQIAEDTTGTVARLQRPDRPEPLIYDPLTPLARPPGAAEWPPVSAINRQ